MYTLAKEVSEVLLPFKELFVQQRSWEKAQSMLVGAILCRGKRTVSRVLTVMGLSQSKQYGKYYRVLSRVGWSGLAGARILLGMILALLSPKQAIVIGIDETLERRWGSKIWGRGIYRDAVKSSIKHQVKSSGVRWQVMQVLLPLPWSKRVWGLPFLSVMVQSKETARVGERGYKSSLDWATQMVSVVSHWLRRSWICVADGGYGNAKFGWACRRHGVSLVARLPKDRLVYMISHRLRPHAVCGVVLAPKALVSYRCNNSLRLLNLNLVDFTLSGGMAVDMLYAN